MKFVRILQSIFLAAAALSATAQISTPTAGSSARKAMMDALRPPVERLLGIPVVFKVYQLRQWHDWAFARVEPLQKNGHSIDYARTKARKEYLLAKDVSWSGECSGLLHRAGKGWKLVKFWHNYSDVAWWGVWDQYGLPQAMFKAD